MTRIANVAISCLLMAGLLTVRCRAFHSANRNNLHQTRAEGTACFSSRRDILSMIVPAALAAITTVTPKEDSWAESSEKTLTEQMFNADGSLKEGYESDVKFRDVKFMWDQSDAFAMNTDGINVENTKAGSQYAISYQYPMRWSDGKDGDPIYFDRTEGINRIATKGITIYQAPGTATIDRLKKASTIGVTKSLDVPKELSRLYKADIVSGRTVEKGENGQKYYEFDMAAAPDTCGNSNENLGLGFCPYDDLFLVSATIVNDRLYCMVVECDSTKMWQVESKELKRIRSTFSIDENVTVEATV